ncbi:MAG: nucleotidyltransferase family protein [Rhodospirillaceae bacterium]
MNGNDTTPESRRSAPVAAPVAALVLAAGLSRRAGAVNKLLADVDGCAMVEVVTATALAAGYAPVLVVTGFEAARIETALAGFDVGFVDNPDFTEGMAASIRHGVSALPEDTAGVLICLGDMPWVSVATLEALRTGFSQSDAATIRRPVKDGVPGNPVLFGCAYFGELLALDGDHGGKSVIQAHLHAVVEIAVEDAGIFRDLDKPGA